MHAIRVLREDHDRIEALLAELADNGGARTFERLDKEIATHTLAEENVFLPQVEDAIEDSKKTVGEFFDERASVLEEASELISESYQKHREIKALLGEMKRCGDGEWKDRIPELRRAVSLQTEREEELFSRAEKVLEEEDFDRLGDLMEHCKWQVRGLAQASLASSSGYRPAAGKKL